MNIIVEQTDTLEHKRQAWEQIKKYPDMAEFITMVSEVFGKPERVEIYDGCD